MNRGADRMRKVTELLAEHAVADPYSYFAGLREAAPLYRDERLGAWLVLRYDDVRAAFRDPRLSADRVSPYFERRRADGTAQREWATFEVLTRWIVFTDPPRHTRLRKLVEYAFRPPCGRTHARLDRLPRRGACRGARNRA